MSLLLPLLFTMLAWSGPADDAGVEPTAERGTLEIRVVDGEKRDSKAWAGWEARARAQLRGLVGDSEVPPPPKDDTGVKGIKVVVDGTGLRRHTCTTEDDGRCRIEGVKPGTYKVFIKESGFQTDARLDVQVTPGESQPVLLELREEPQIIIVT